MIQFNLLPDVKQEYIRAKRTKRLVMVVSSLISGVALLIFVLLLLSVMVVQKTHMNNLSDKINNNSKNLQNTQDIDKILTIQNQLNSLPKIHQDKPAITRVFTFVKQVTPSTASIATFTVNFDDQTVIINGTADTLSTVNKFVDTLKFTTYKDADTTPPAFSEVVLSSFGKADNRASYTINLKFDPKIFANGSSVELTVPAIITTRSELEKPSALFEQSVTPAGQGQ